MMRDNQKKQKEILIEKTLTEWLDLKDHAWSSKITETFQFQRKYGQLSRTRNFYPDVHLIDYDLYVWIDYNSGNMTSIKDAIVSSYPKILIITDDCVANLNSKKVTHFKRILADKKKLCMAMVNA